MCVAEKVLSAVAVAARLALTPFIFRNALKINAKVVAEFAEESAGPWTMSCLVPPSPSLSSTFSSPLPSLSPSAPLACCLPKAKVSNSSPASATEAALSFIAATSKGGIRLRGRCRLPLYVNDVRRVWQCQTGLDVIAACSSSNSSSSTRATFAYS